MKRLALGLLLSAGFAPAAIASSIVAAAGDALYAAFRETCDGPPVDYDAMVASATAHGWAAVAPDSDPGLSGIFAMMDEREEDDPEQVSSYRRTLASGDAFLLLQHVTFDEDSWANCTVFDFAAKAPLSYPDMAGWIGRTGKVLGKISYGFVAYWLGPGDVPNHQWVLSVRYNPPDGIFTNIDGFIGTAIESRIRPAAAATEVE